MLQGFLRAGKLFKLAEKYDSAEKMLQQALPLAQSNSKAVAVSPNRLMT